MNKLKDILEMVKGSFEIIKIIAIVVLFISSLMGFKSCQDMKEKYQQAESILTTKEKEFTNRMGEAASQVNVIKLRYNKLEEASEKYSKDRTEYEKKLAKAYQEIEIYKRKNKDLISYQSSTLQAIDTILIPMKADCIQQIEPIKLEHLELSFEYCNDSLVKIPYKYTTDISTIVSLFPKKKENGKNHFPNWGILWGYDKVSITTVKDKNATITNNVSIDFKK